MTTTSDASIEITTRWDRPAVATGHGETYLVITIQTGQRPRQTTRPPVDVSFVIDRSGSMHGLPLSLARKGVIDALKLLDDRDTFNVVAYDHTVMTLTRQRPATRDQKQSAARDIQGLEPGGSTDMYGGWQAGCNVLRDVQSVVPNRSGQAVKRVILLTDGLANVGVTEPAAIATGAAGERSRGVTTSTLGLGTGIDEAILASMAEAGGGNFAFVEHARDLPAFFARELGEALAVVAGQVTLTLTLPKGMRGSLLNPFPVERSGKELTIAIGDAPAGMTLDLVFSITTREKREGPLPPLDLRATWADTETGVAQHVSAPIDPVMVINPADFASMPRDGEASRAVSEMIAATAKREAITQYRRGNRTGAREMLGTAMGIVGSAPMARPGLVHEMSELMDLDPSTPEFEVQRRQVINDEHRRSRGRDL